MNDEARTLDDDTAARAEAQQRITELAGDEVFQRSLRGIDDSGTTLEDLTPQREAKAEWLRLHAAAQGVSPDVLANPHIETEEYVTEAGITMTRPVSPDAEPPSRQEAEATLQRRWGEGWQANADAAAATVSDLGDGWREAMNRTGLGDDPALVEVFHELSQRPDRDLLIGELRAISREDLSAVDARARRERLMTDPAFIEVWTDAGNIRQPQASARMEALRLWADPPRPVRRLLKAMGIQR